MSLSDAITIKVDDADAVAVYVNDVRVWPATPLPEVPPDEWPLEGEPIYVGGARESAWTAKSGYSGGSTSRTIMSPGIAIRAATKIRSIKVNTYQGSNTGKVKMFRHNGTNWDLVAEQSFTVSSTAVTVTLSPEWDALPGDVLGVWLQTTGAGVRGSNQHSFNTLYTTGDVTGTGQTFASTDPVDLEVEARGRRVWLGIAADSICGGYTDWQTHLDTYVPGSWVHTIPGGRRLNELGYVLSGLVDGLTWVNCGRGSQTFAWGAQDGGGVDAALAFQPHTLLVHFGANDVAAGRTWSQVEADLDTIRAKATAGGVRRLVIPEILPDSNTTNTKAALIRTWNSNLAAWCAANDAHLVVAHDAMGKTRAATGFKDDLADAYDKGDGVHLSQAGVAALAALIAPVLLP